MGLFLMLQVVFIHAVNTDTRITGMERASAGPSPCVFIQNYVSHGLGIAAVPLFFAISGYLFFRDRTLDTRDYVAKLSRRFRTIVVPYLLWSALWIVALAGAYAVPCCQRFFTRPDWVIRSKTLSELAQTWLLSPIPYQFWFLRTLLILLLLAPLIYQLVRRCGEMVLLAVGVLWVLQIQVVPVKVGGTFLVSSETAFFFLLGSCLALKRPDGAGRELPGRRVLLMLWLALAGVLIYRRTFAGAGVMETWEPLVVLLGAGALWCNYDLLRPVLECRLATWLTQWTFVIYAAHEPVLAILKKLLIYFAGFHEGLQLLAFFALPILTVALCVAAAVPLKLLARPAYDILTGGR